MYDSVIGYNYFGARYYDSRIGRWLQVDPLAEKYFGWSPYVNVRDNPLVLIDPNGMGIWLPGKGFIKGPAAREITFQVLYNSFNGKSAKIPFVQKTSDLPEQLSELIHQTYKEGGMGGASILQFGYSINVYNSGVDVGGYDEFWVNTQYSNQEIYPSGFTLQGQSSKGEDVITLNFLTADDSHNDVVKFTGTVSTMNKYLKQFGKIANKRTRKETIKKADGTMFEREIVDYTLDDIIN
ncbi:MAG: hypothetical protein LC122_14445 [Chitinophagales bacterium]|nr:hypothetical protein [Chitinophagales bacterium]